MTCATISSHRLNAPCSVCGHAIEGTVHVVSDDGVLQYQSRRRFYDLPHCPVHKPAEHIEQPSATIAGEQTGLFG